MSVNLVVARISLGEDVSDKLFDDDYGLNHGDVTNNMSTLEEILYLRHDDPNPITDVKLHIDGLAELLQMADTDPSYGLLMDTDNDSVYDSVFKTGQGDSLPNAINLGSIAPSSEKIIRVKINVPSTVNVAGVRSFNLNFNFDYTP